MLPRRKIEIYLAVIHYYEYPNVGILREIDDLFLKFHNAHPLPYPAKSIAWGADFVKGEMLTLMPMCFIIYI